MHSAQKEKKKSNILNELFCSSGLVEWSGFVDVLVCKKNWAQAGNGQSYYTIFI